MAPFRFTDVNLDDGCSPIRAGPTTGRELRAFRLGAGTPAVTAYIVSVGLKTTERGYFLGYAYQ
jgi:hypothetical protein